MNFRKWMLIIIGFGGMVMLSPGCSKDEDTTAPAITLNGSDEVEIDLQEVYNELGATANDGEDGSVAVTISGTVNNNLKGEYPITYTATDAAGNVATAERIVRVVNSADFLGGNYINAFDSCATTGTALFDASVGVSNTLNGAFAITGFGAFGPSAVIACQYNSTTNKITASTPQSLGGGANMTQMFSSSSVTSEQPAIFIITYQWLDSGGASDICTSTYTK